MYLGRVSCDIGLGAYRLLGANTIEIKESIHSVIWTCRLAMPNYVITKQGGTKVREALETKIKIGDPVSVAFGYDGNNNLEFEGYIKNINHVVPLEIECENIVFLFRSIPIKKVFNDTLKSALEYLITEVNKAKGTRIKLSDNVPDVKLVNFEVKDRSGLWMLQELLDKYPMFAIYFKGQIMHCHMRYFVPSDDKVKYVIDKNTAESSELKYDDNPEDVRVIFEVKDVKGKVIKKEFGSNTAEKIVTKRLSGVFTEVALKKIADQEIAQMSYAGFKGSLTAFIIPTLSVPIVANISHPEFANRDGNYIIGTQTKTLDTSSGIMRKLDIDFRLPK